MQQLDRSCPANIVLPASTVKLIRERATEFWGHAATSLGHDVVLVSSPNGDARPLGAFGVVWGSPCACEATITELVWDSRRATAEDVRRAINFLAGWPVAWHEMAAA